MKSVLAFVLAASFVAAACSSSSSAPTVASGCYASSQGLCVQYFIDLPDLAQSCAGAGGLYKAGSSPCPTASVVGTCACPPEPEGKRPGPVVFYAPKFTCEAAKSACGRCLVDAAGNATPGSFTGPC